MQNKQQIMHDRIEKHGNDLNAIFDTPHEPVKLCKKLFRLESAAHRLSTQWCNGFIDSDKWSIETDKIIDKVYDILGKNKCIETGLFVNGDARGYALKLSSDWTTGYRDMDRDIYCDWGGYGIVAPEFNGLK